MQFLRKLREISTRIQDAILAHPVTRALDQQQDAVKEVARRSAEVHYQQHLVDFYDEEAGKVNPYVDWNHFANLKNKWVEHSNDLLVEKRRLERSMAAADACAERVNKLREALTK